VGAVKAPTIRRVSRFGRRAVRRSDMSGIGGWSLGIDATLYLGRPFTDAAIRQSWGWKTYVARLSGCALNRRSQPLLIEEDLIDQLLGAIADLTDTSSKRREWTQVGHGDAKTQEHHCVRHFETHPAQACRRGRSAPRGAVHSAAARCAVTPWAFTTTLIASSTRSRA
jgi:hypothetical protein